MYMLLHFTSTDKLKKIVLFIFLLYGLGLLGHISTFFIFYLIFGEYIFFDFLSTYSMYASLIAMFITISLYLVFLAIWKRYIGAMRSDIPNIGAFLFIIGGQLLYNLNNMLNIISHSAEIDLLAVAGTMIMVIGNIAILQILITTSKKKEAEDELKKTRHAMELEQSHYRETEKRREELIKIRHDFNNQLSVISRLIRTGEENLAQDMISTLSKEIIETKENPYCNIPVINAILTDKAKTCKELGIMFAVNLELPQSLSVEQMHLCSVFSNLLDNAINACKNQKSTNTPTIQLNSMVDGDYLFIKLTNPSNEPHKKPMAGRGYGSQILLDLSARYGGSYRGEYNAGVFTAVVTLLTV